MGLFSKAEYLEVVLPFLCDNSSDDAAACVISIEAYGRILDEYKYCYAYSLSVDVNNFVLIGARRCLQERKYHMHNDFPDKLVDSGGESSSKLLCSELQFCFLALPLWYSLET